MDETKALGIISMLANGVSPMTGEVFPPESPYQSSDVVRALFVAARALDAQTKASAPTAVPAVSRNRTLTPGNVGKPWSPEEDQRLIAEFDRGRSPRDLAGAHGRTLAGIEARLEKLGRITAQQRVTTNRYGAERGTQGATANSAQR